MSKLIGQILGDFRVEALLSSGSGGMGQVYQAVRISDNERFALKVLYQQLADDLHFRARFRDEVKALQLLDHPNVVKLYGAGVTDDPLYLVMEYVPDGSLQTLLERRATHPWPLMLGLDLVRQAAEGLAAIHAKGIVHRDIKPSNLLLRRIDQSNPRTDAATNAEMEPGEAYQLKIGDFGIAQLGDSSRKTVTKQKLGTPRYIAPEQLKDPRSADARSDIYALGAILYEVATGAPPLPIQDMGDAAFHHLVTPIPLPRRLNHELPLALEALIMDCLARHPTDRLASSAELAARLGTLLEAERQGLSTQAAPLSQDPLHIDSSPLIGVSLDHTTLTLTPCQRIELRVTIRNLSSRVDDFTITVTGFPESWLTLPSEPVRVNDKDTASATLGILVPEGSEGRAGTYESVLVCARSGNDAAEVGVQPASWIIREFAGCEVRIEPRRVTGKRQAAYELFLRNSGNIAASYKLSPGDDMRNLSYTFVDGKAPFDLTEPLKLEPGEDRTLTLTTRASRHWLGREREHHFAVAVTGGNEPQQVKATLVQRPVIPAWAITLAMLIVGLLAFIAFSPPIFWFPSASGVGGTTLRDDDPVVVRWRSFNALSPKIKPGEVAVPASGNALLRWLGLEPWEYTFIQGFSQTTQLSISATNLFGLNENTSAPFPAEINAQEARGGLKLEPDEVLFGEPVTVTLTLEPATEEATLQDSSGKPVATITRLSKTDKLTRTVRLILNSATGVVTSIDNDPAVSVQPYPVEPLRQLVHTYQLLALNPGSVSSAPATDRVVVVPKMSEFTLEVLGTEVAPPLQAEAQVIALSSAAPQEQARLTWSVEGTEKVTLTIEDKEETTIELDPTGSRNFILADLTAARVVKFTLTLDGRVLGEGAVQITPLVCEVAYDGTEAPLFLLRSYHNKKDVPVDPDFDLRPQANEGQPRRVIPRLKSPQGDWVEVEPLNVESPPGWLPANTLRCPDENRLRGVQPRQLLEPTNTATPTLTNTPLPTPTSIPTPTADLAATATEEARRAGAIGATATQIAALTATRLALDQAATQTIVAESNAATQTIVALTMTAEAEQTAAAETAAAETAAAETAAAETAAAETAAAETAAALAAPLTVRVTIDRVDALDDMEGAFQGDPDFYARVSIADKSFRTGSRDGQDDLRPGDWVFEYQTSRSQRRRVPIMIDIWDEDGGGGGDDDHVDLTQPDGRTLVLELELETCIVRGAVLGSCGATLESSGAGNDRARIWFRIELLQ